MPNDNKTIDLEKELDKLPDDYNPIDDVDDNIVSSEKTQKFPIKHPILITVFASITCLIQIFFHWFLGHNVENGVMWQEIQLPYAIAAFLMVHWVIGFIKINKKNRYKLGNSAFTAFRVGVCIATLLDSFSAAILAFCGIETWQIFNKAYFLEILTPTDYGLSMLFGTLTFIVAYFGVKELKYKYIDE